MAGLRIVRVSRQYLEYVLRADMKGVSSDAPEDMEVCAVARSDITTRPDEFEFVCRSADWKPGVEGALIPEVDITYETEKSDA